MHLPAMHDKSPFWMWFMWGLVAAKAAAFVAHLRPSRFQAVDPSGAVSSGSERIRSSYIRYGGSAISITIADSVPKWSQIILNLEHSPSQFLSHELRWLAWGGKLTFCLTRNCDWEQVLCMFMHFSHSNMQAIGIAFSSQELTRVSI